MINNSLKIPKISNKTDNFFKYDGIVSEINKYLLRVGIAAVNVRRLLYTLSLYTVTGSELVGR